MLCRKLEMLPVECVVRGYLAGSGWKDYRETGAVCGHVLPEGLEESARLPEPIFTPATKAVEGHDENIDEERAAALCGEERFAQAKEASLALYRFGAAYAEARGIVLADTKFEFGVAPDGTVMTRGRGTDPGLLSLLARGRVPTRTRAAVVRQAVRAGLVRGDRLEQGGAGPGAARGRRRGHARPVRRGVRAAHGDRVRGVPGASGGRPVKALGARAAEGGDPRSSGRRRRPVVAQPRLRRRERSRGPHRRSRAHGRRRSTRRARRSTGCAPSSSPTRSSRASRSGSRSEQAARRSRRLPGLQRRP